jgi:hypothetical protein
MLGLGLGLTSLPVIGALRDTFFDNLETETGDNLLLESGDFLLLE